MVELRMVVRCEDMERIAKMLRIVGVFVKRSIP
jgi:hypothetical protein